MRFRATIAVAGLLLCCSAAQADPAPEPVTDLTAAKIHYDAGARLYEAKRYREALQEFDAAFQVSGRPALLYNMGRCHEELGDEKEAIRDYEDFLANGPNNPDRANVKKHISALRERIASVEAGLTSAPVPAAHRPMRRYPFIIGGIGLAVFAAAIGTGVVARQRQDELDSNCPGGLCPASFSTAREVRDSGEHLAIATDVLIGVGSAAVLASVITIAIEAHRAR